MKAGVAERILLDSLTPENLIDKVTKVIEDPRFYKVHFCF